MASILMVAGEGLPFIKTGGLADVIGSLPPELLKKGLEICGFMCYTTIMTAKVCREVCFS